MAGTPATAFVQPVPARWHAVASPRASTSGSLRGFGCAPRSALRAVPAKWLAAGGAVAATSVAVARHQRRHRKKGLQLPFEPSLPQVIRVLRRVDPALGNLAQTVSEVWGLLQTELVEMRGGDEETVQRTGALLVHLFALGRLKAQQGSGFQLPQAEVPLVSDLARLSEAQRLVRFAVASYGANLLALVGLLQFRDAWPPAGPGRDGAAAARFLKLPSERFLARGKKTPRKHHRSGAAFRPWWVLFQDDNDLVLSIRGSANMDDIATDLACANCEFLHGHAHEGMAGAVTAVWDEAGPAVTKALESGPYKRFIVCGHSLGGSVSLLLGMKLRAEALLPVEVRAFAAGPPPAFQGPKQPGLESGLISVINRFDPVPHLSLDAALRMVLAAERLAEAGMSWSQTLGILVGGEVDDPKFEDLIAKIPQQRASLRIPGEAIWLVDACAGRLILPIDLSGRLDEFCRELPEITVAQSALDHVMSTYVYNMDKAADRLKLEAGKLEA